MKVRLKREIVSMGVEGIDPNRLVGTYVEPKDWNAHLLCELAFLSRCTVGEPVKASRALREAIKARQGGCPEICTDVPSTIVIAMQHQSIHGLSHLLYAPDIDSLCF